MRSLLILAVVGTVLAFNAPAHAVACTGSASCRACTNCTRCAHCKAGGTCRVCARSTTPIAPPITPRTTPATTPPPSTPPAPTSADRRAEALKEARDRADRELAARKEAAKPKAIEQDGIRIYFSPSGGCTTAIVEEIGKAKTTIDVQAYRLTSLPIVKALADAHKRGVKVIILLDRAQQSTKYSDATYFHNAGMTVLIDPSHAIAHNKVIIIDGATVVTGSFNFSAAAESANAENLLIIEGKAAIAAGYTSNFAEHRKHCAAYRPPAGTAGLPDTRPAGESIDPESRQADASELLRNADLLNPEQIRWQNRQP
jgi:phosphatidylserine/phosphatidylglycerophosphate/cardiolipin synthase-like enzyme